MNWQLNKIANELNQFERIRSYVDYYSDSGTLQDALDGIISAKKQIEHDKKMVSYAKKKYRPIIKIYDEMKEIEKEHTFMNTRMLQNIVQSLNNIEN